MLTKPFALNINIDLEEYGWSNYVICFNSKDSWASYGFSILNDNPSDKGIIG